MQTAAQTYGRFRLDEADSGARAARLEPVLVAASAPARGNGGARHSAATLAALSSKAAGAHDRDFKAF